MDNLIVSWDSLHSAVRLLCQNHLTKRRFSRIVAVARGGLIPAAIVARELSIRRVESLCVSSYDGQKKLGKLSIANHITDSPDTLVIDDLSDTGNTAQSVLRLLPSAFFATVFVKPAGQPFVHAFTTSVPQSTWIHFPWDTSLQPCLPISS